jgi:phytoene dehydrogenase-like protein
MGFGLRYDAAIIGAGADGLAAAATLARSGLKTIVLERAEKPGGRLVTREFHPGFRASPFCDELPPIPAEIFWELDLARRSALFVPSPISTAWWPDRRHVIERAIAPPPLLRARDQLAVAAAARARNDLASPTRSLFARKPVRDPWPGEDWCPASLRDLFAVEAGGDVGAHLTAQALTGRAAHPDHAGSALQFLSPGLGQSGVVIGGLERLGAALAAAATDAGAEISCGLEVSDVRHTGRRVQGLTLADGSHVEVRAIVSTLDLKRTFLSLFSWNALPAEAGRRVASFRMNGSTARVLLALSKKPAGDLTGPIHVAPDIEAFGTAYAGWRSGVLPDTPPCTLRISSALDLSLAPIGAAVMTVTLGCVPARLFDGAWTHQKRTQLLRIAMLAGEKVFPGIASTVVGADILTPADIEEALGLTDGDLWGGEIAADQMFGMRPWTDVASPRTPFKGMYLAGPSAATAPFGTCLAGVVAARAIIADHAAGRLR